MEAGDVRAEVIAEGHFGERGGDAGLSDVMEGEEFAGRVELVEGFRDLAEFVQVWQVVRVAGNLDEGNLRSAFFELR